MTRRTHSMRLSAFVLILGIIVLVGCESEPTSPIATTPGSVAENMEQYRDSLVTVSGEVDEIYSPRIFTVGGAGFQEDLLVISAEQVGVAAGRTAEQPLKKRDVVQVTGIAEVFNETNLERTYDLEIASNVAEMFSEEPVVIAASGASVLSKVTVTPRRGAARTVPMDTNPITSLQTLAESQNPGQHADRMAVFADVEIHARVDTNAFWIGSTENERLFVTLPEASVQQIPDPGERWTVYGVLREVPSQTELQVEWDVTQEIARALTDDEVYLYGVQGEPSGN